MHQGQNLLKVMYELTHGFSFTMEDIVKEKGLNFIYAFQKAAVAVRIETITFLHGVTVGGFHAVGSGNGANQHKQG